MKIEILGTGCPKCRQLNSNVERAVEELKIQADIVKVTNLNEIMNYGIMITPGLAIDGQVKSAGKVLSVEEVKNLIKG